MKAETHDFYTLRLGGILESDWADWFDGMTISYPENLPGETVLSGYVADQPALHGLLEKIRDLNIRLIVVEQSTPPGPPL